MTVEEMLKKIREEVAQERRDYKGPHCCLTLESELLDEETVFGYNSNYREYGVKIFKSARMVIMKYCVCCGKKLPDSLRACWAITLKNENGLLDPMGSDKKRIPQEFLTDEWWKRRLL